MTYNMTAWEQCDHLACAYFSANSISATQIATFLLLIGVFVALTLVMLRRNSPAESFLAAGVVCLFFSIFLLAAGYSGLIWVTVFGAISGASAIAIFTKR